MPELINTSSVEEAKSIMKDKFPMMIEFFFEDAETYIISMQEGIDQNDIEKVKSPAHTIKSSSNQLGAEKLSEIAMKMEHMAINMLDNKGGSIEELNSLFQELKSALAETEPELKKYM